MYRKSSLKVKKFEKNGRNQGINQSNYLRAALTTNKRNDKE